jgi:hypothetical protein
MFELGAAIEGISELPEATYLFDYETSKTVPEKYYWNPIMFLPLC